MNETSLTGKASRQMNLRSFNDARAIVRRFVTSKSGSDVVYWAVASISVLTMVALWEWFLLGYKYGVPRGDDINYYYWAALRMEQGENWLSVLREGHGPNMTVEHKLISWVNLSWFGYDMRWYNIAGPLCAAGWCLLLLTYARKLGAAWWSAPVVVLLAAPPVMYRAFDYNMIAIDGSLNLLSSYILFLGLERFLRDRRFGLLLAAALYKALLIASTGYQVTFAAAMAAGLLASAALWLESGSRLPSAEVRSWLKRLGLCLILFTALHLMYGALLESPPGRWGGALSFDPVGNARAVANAFFVALGGGQVVQGPLTGWENWQIGAVGLLIFTFIGVLSLRSLIRRRAVFVLAVAIQPLVTIAGVVFLRGEEAALFPRYSGMFAPLWVAAVLGAIAYTYDERSRTAVRAAMWSGVAVLVALNLVTANGLMGYRGSAARAERAADQLLMEGDLSGDFNVRLFNCRRSMEDCRAALLDIRARREGGAAPARVPTR